MIGVLSQQLGNKGKSVALHWLQELFGQRLTEEGDLGDLGLTLALKSLTEMTDEGDWKGTTLGQLQGNIISIWLDELLEAATRRYAKLRRLEALAGDVFYLHNSELDDVLKHLMKSLLHQSTDVRGLAHRVLKDLGQRVPIEQLLVLLNNPDEDVRRAAIRILSAQSEHIPFRSLLAALDDKDEDVRWTAIEILRTQGKRVSLEVLEYKESEYH